jgi:hypothetical protein
MHCTCGAPRCAGTVVPRVTWSRLLCSVRTPQQPECLRRREGSGRRLRCSGRSGRFGGWRRGARPGTTHDRLGAGHGWCRHAWGLGRRRGRRAGGFQRSRLLRWPLHGLGSRGALGRRNRFRWRSRRRWDQLFWQACRSFSRSLPRARLVGQRGRRRRRRLLHGRGHSLQTGEKPGHGEHGQRETNRHGHELDEPETSRLLLRRTTEWRRGGVGDRVVVVGQVGFPVTAFVAPLVSVKEKLVVYRVVALPCPFSPPRPCAERRHDERFRPKLRVGMRVCLLRPGTRRVSGFGG